MLQRRGRHAAGGLFTVSAGAARCGRPLSYGLSGALPLMAVGRAERFEERKPRVIAVFGDDEATLHAGSQSSSSWRWRGTTATGKGSVLSSA